MMVKKRRDEQGERKAEARGKRHCWPARAAEMQVLDEFIQQDGLVEVQGDGEPLESGGDVELATRIAEQGLGSDVLLCALSDLVVVRRERVLGGVLPRSKSRSSHRSWSLSGV